MTLRAAIEDITRNLRHEAVSIHELAPQRAFLLRVAGALDEALRAGAEPAKCPDCKYPDDGHPDRVRCDACGWPVTREPEAGAENWPGVARDAIARVKACEQENARLIHELRTVQQPHVGQAPALNLPAPRPTPCLSSTRLASGETRIRCTLAAAHTGVHEGRATNGGLVIWESTRP